MTLTHTPTSTLAREHISSIARPSQARMHDHGPQGQHPHPWCHLVTILGRTGKAGVEEVSVEGQEPEGVPANTPAPRPYTHTGEASLPASRGADAHKGGPPRAWQAPTLNSPTTLRRARSSSSEETRT